MKNTHKPILDRLLNISIYIKYVWFPQKKNHDFKEICNDFNKELKILFKRNIDAFRV